MSHNPARLAPVSQFPAATSRSPDAWLNDSSTSADPQAISTRLQGLAFARAADISVGAAVFSLGITAILHVAEREARSRYPRSRRSLRAGTAGSSA